MATTAQSMMDLVKAKRAAMQAASGRREATVKPQPGKSRWRILPSWRGAEELTFFQEFGQHFIKGVDGVLKAVYVCTEKTLGKPCDICEGLAAASVRTDDEKVKEALKESRSKGRVLMNALHLDGEDPTTPVILDLTPTTFGQLLDLMEEHGNITDLKEGVDIVISRTGKGLNTEYLIQPAAKSAPVDSKVLKKLNDLDKYVMQEYEEGHMKALAAVSAISGLLPAPSARPALAASAASPEAGTWEAPPVAGIYDTVASSTDDDIPFDSGATAGAESEEMSDADLDALLDEMK